MSKVIASGAYIVSFDFSTTDTGVLIVGQRVGETVNIINAFEGAEAFELYTKLTTKKSEVK